MPSDTEEPSPARGPFPRATGPDDGRAVARLMRQVRFLAMPMIVVLAVTAWNSTWPIPGLGPRTAAPATIAWLLATNLWSSRHDDGHQQSGVTVEVASDVLLALVMTVAGGALLARIQPMIGLLVVVEAAARLPRRPAYATTGLFASVAVTAVLAQWPSWAGWQPQDRLAEAIPTALGLPIAALLVAGLAADRMGARRIASTQGRRLARVARQLSDANHRLEASNQELMAFAGRIAHDLRTPLGTVVTTLETLRRQGLELAPDVRDQLMDQAHHAATRSIDTVAALLDHASADGRAPRRSLVAVRELASDVLSTLPDDMLGGREVVLPGSDAMVWGDPHLLRLVLQNLITNALTHGGPDVRRIRVAVESDDRERLVSVEDDGDGVPVGEREQAFAAGTRHSSTEGLGIGLATCASIVERHGGRIWIDDSVLGGAGVRFTLTCPTDDVDPVPAAGDDVIDAGPAPDEGQGTRATISSSGSSRPTWSDPYLPGSAPAMATTSSPACTTSPASSRAV